MGIHPAAQPSPGALPQKRRGKGGDDVIWQPSVWCACMMHRWLHDASMIAINQCHAHEWHVTRTNKKREKSTSDAPCHLPPGDKRVNTAWERKHAHSHRDVQQQRKNWKGDQPLNKAGVLLDRPLFEKADWLKCPVFLFFQESKITRIRVWL